MKKFHLIFIVLPLLFSCEKEKQSSTYDMNVDVYIIDANGNDLLNPSNSDNPEYIDKDIIVVKGLEGTNKLTVNGNHPAPEFFIVLPPDKRHDKYRIQFYFSPMYNPSSLLITWNNTDSDTLSGDIKKEENNISCTKVYLNDVVVWEASKDSDERLITLKKGQS